MPENDMLNFIRAYIEVVGLPKYWGIYCPQHDCWYQKPNGELFFYPSPDIAKAHLENDFTGKNPMFPIHHEWEVTEFGKQKYLPSNKGAGRKLCPVE